MKQQVLCILAIAIVVAINVTTAKDNKQIRRKANRSIAKYENNKQIGRKANRSIAKYENLTHHQGDIMNKYLAKLNDYLSEMVQKYGIERNNFQFDPSCSLSNYHEPHRMATTYKELVEELTKMKEEYGNLFNPNNEDLTNYRKTYEGIKGKDLIHPYENCYSDMFSRHPIDVKHLIDLMKAADDASWLFFKYDAILRAYKNLSLPF
ncbi:unnamed protein product [Heterobilharzia americana]|nr:unnamed protein product [Heterobilharzia americana]